MRARLVETSEALEGIFTRGSDQSEAASEEEHGSSNGEPSNDEEGGK